MAKYSRNMQIWITRKIPQENGVPRIFISTGQEGLVYLMQDAGCGQMPHPSEVVCLELSNEVLPSLGSFITGAIMGDLARASQGATRAFSDMSYQLQRNVVDSVRETLVALTKAQEDFFAKVDSLKTKPAKITTPKAKARKHR